MRRIPQAFLGHLIQYMHIRTTRGPELTAATCSARPSGFHGCFHATYHVRLHGWRLRYGSAVIVRVTGATALRPEQADRSNRTTSTDKKGVFRD